MEDDNCSPSFTSQADEVPGRKGANPSSSSPGYFSTVIPPASAICGNPNRLSFCSSCATVELKGFCSSFLKQKVIAKDLSHSDFCWTLNKQRNEGGSADAQRATSDCKSQGCPTKRQVTKNKDEKSVHPNESVESPCFGSSVHYGGRDFYMSSLSMQTTETSESYKTDDGVDWGNRHAADRGDWWQGSLYY
ncbi:uncharacterized protein LOC135620411 [Musa acuminata AAA Group]|uniref:uncharacterized protein LOC135620411 n=1 Tax=Musa acuminata AAA Group TaxID=214697 RepID=UPI0031DD75F4